MTEPRRAGQPEVSQPSGARLTIRLPDASQLPLPEAANFFQFAWGGTDVQLLVGYLDMNVAAAAKPGSIVEVTPQVSHRFFLSVRGFAFLRAQMDEAAANMIRSGIPLDQLNPIATTQP